MFLIVWGILTKKLLAKFLISGFLLYCIIIYLRVCMKEKCFGLCRIFIMQHSSVCYLSETLFITKIACMVVILSRFLGNTAVDSFNSQAQVMIPIKVIHQHPVQLTKCIEINADIAVYRNASKSI